MFGNKGAVEDIPDGITKIRIWRELLATCDKIEKKFERLIEAEMFLLLNKTEHFVLKKKHAESELTKT